MSEIELPAWVEEALFRPELEAAARESWARARELGGRPELEWAFPVNVVRGNALLNPVLSPFYEPLSSWDEVIAALRAKDVLESHAQALAPDVLPYVGLGFEVFDGAFDARHGHLLLPADGERFRGRHWTWQAFHQDPETIAFRNTWGRGWGHHGVGYISRAYFEAHVDAILVQRPLFTGTSPAMAEALIVGLWKAGQPGGANPSEWAKAWSVPNPRLTRQVEIGGRRFERWRRTVLSFSSGWPPAHAYDLVEDESRLIGRFHLLELPGRDTVIQELWVAPEHRRKGFGSFLEKEACSLARWLGKSLVSAPLFEADARSPTRGAAVAFAETHGYVWKWHETRRPNTVGVATKELPS